MSARPRSSIGSLLTALAMCAWPAASWAQSTTWYPSQTGASVLAYEDQWPSVTDYDYNDVVLQAHWAFDRDTTRPASTNGYPVLRAVLTLDPVALGGDHDNGLGLQLPACVSSAGLSVQRRLGTGGSSTQSPTYGPWQTIVLSADSAPTAVLSENLRELFAGEAGRLNVGVPGKDARLGQRLEVQFEWPVAVDLDTSQAPFDLYIFRSADPAHEIHFPTYSGTDAMRATLFPPSNAPGKRYVNDRGIPAALNLKTATVYPTEATPIEAVFPDIVPFASLPSFDAWSGPGNDPRRFYERAGGTGGRRTRSGAPLRPARAASSRTSCTEGLAAGRSGVRVRSNTACVDADPATGMHAEAGVCMANARLCTPANAPANEGDQTWNGTWGACLARTCSSGFSRRSGACVAPLYESPDPHSSSVRFFSSFEPGGQFIVDESANPLPASSWGYSLHSSQTLIGMSVLGSYRRSWNSQAVASAVKFHPNSSDFTLEFWLYLPGGAGSGMPIVHYETAQNGRVLVGFSTARAYDSSGQLKDALEVATYNPSTGGRRETRVTGNIPVQTELQVALVRSGGWLAMRVNGENLAIVPYVDPPYHNSMAVLRIGDIWTGGTYFLDDLRLTVGVARYPL
jgi:LruC domain-containing protein